MAETPVVLPPHAEALVAAEARSSVHARRGWLFGLARLIAVVMAVIAVWTFIAEPGASRFAMIIAVGAAVLGLGLAQQAVDDQRRRSEALAEYHRRGLDRCADRWLPGRSGTAPAVHPYAHDLDLIGPLGLLARLGAETSPAGCRRLTAWALDDTTPVDHQRPEAVRVLSLLHPWRARLAAAVVAGDEGTSMASLGAALAGGFHGPARWQIAAAWLLRIMALAAVAAALLRFGPDTALWTVLAVAAVLGPIDVAMARRFSVLGDSERQRTALAALARGLAVAAELEGESDPYLRRLGARCALAQDAARILAKLLASVAQRRDPLWTFLVCGPLQLATRDAAALADWATRYRATFSTWCDDLSDAESLAALATWAAEQGGCWPQWSTAGALLEARNLAHPLLPRAVRSGNDTVIERGSVWLITGANASGKSTWLRSCALAVVLARLGTTVPATSLCLRPLRIAATMRAGDDLAAGLSRFQAEVASLARAWKRVDEPGDPLLLVLDEILAGTNSHERHLACRALISRLAGADTATLVSTHDLALASLAENRTEVHLAHFADTAAPGSDDLAFDYRLRPGVTQTTNALTVLRRAGIPLAE